MLDNTLDATAWPVVAMFSMEYSEVSRYCGPREESPR